MLADTPHTFSRQVLLAVADLVMMGGLLYLCYMAAPTPPPSPDSMNVLLLGLLAPVTLMFHLGGAYLGANQTTLGTWIRHAWLTFWVAVGLFFAAAYVLKISAYYPRAVIGPWLVAVSLGMAVVRWLLFFDMERRHRHGRGLERTLLAGSLSMCQAFSRHAEANPVLGIKVVGMCSDGLLAVGEGKELVVGDYERLEAMVAELEVHRVMVCGNFDDQKLVVNIMNRLLNYPVTVQYVPDMSQFPVFSLRVGDYAGQPVINLSSSPLTERALFIKWIEDKVIGGLILLLIAPLLVGIALAVKFTSPGPVLFIQDRHGLGGARIRVMKFRTMFHNTARKAASGGALEPRGAPAEPDHHSTIDLPPGARDADAPGAGARRHPTPAPTAAVAAAEAPPVRETTRRHRSLRVEAVSDGLRAGREGTREIRRLPNRLGDTTEPQPEEEPTAATVPASEPGPGRGRAPVWRAHPGRLQAGLGERPAHHPARPLPAQDQPRRAAPVPQRHQGRHVDRRPAPARGPPQRAVRQDHRRADAPPLRQAGDHRHGADQRRARRDADHQRHAPAPALRPLLHPQLVAVAGPQDHRPDAVQGLHQPPAVGDQPRSPGPSGRARIPCTSVRTPRSRTRPRSWR